MGWRVLTGGGWLTTRQIKTPSPAVEGSSSAAPRLTINAKCATTAAAVAGSGSPCISVDVLDAAGSPLAGYSGADAARFSGDAINASLSWSGRSALPCGAVLALNISVGAGAQLFGLRWA